MDEDSYVQDFQLDGDEVIKKIIILLRKSDIPEKVRKGVQVQLKSYLHPNVVLTFYEREEIIEILIDLGSQLIHWLEYSEVCYKLTEQQRALIENIVVNNAQSALNRAFKGLTLKVMGQVRKTTEVINKEYKPNTDKKSFLGKPISKPMEDDDELYG